MSGYVDRPRDNKVVVVERYVAVLEGVGVIFCVF